MATALDAGQTAARLPWPALVDEIEALLRDASVHIPERIVMPTAHGAVLFVMPGCDARVAMTKLISFTPANVGTATPTIQGDVTVFDVASGTRRVILDGPTVTARRTAAVSALGARWLAPNTAGPMLIVGAGVQGRAHLEVFAQVLGVSRFFIASRSAASARALVDHAQALGLQAELAPDADAALAGCPLAVTCTPASGVVLRALPRADAFIAAVGAFTPQMVELAPDLCRHMAAQGHIVVDTREAEHEAGDLLQAGIDVAACPSLGDVVRAGQRGGRGPVLFKSCGWAGWDLAAARLALGG
ncbi:MAG: delta(1)-pyrroline-2-carboxylate reductase family protein [Burkholderiales bacterium]|uniref:delta(1)-pyrroline-2-carboxylate reductase family protein n=1 Tax=Ottowia sp. TaxID=1898956 RepID=UPI001AD24374|nr:delta(1)-pyrroline-2-carboxylate reductase family protein [Ottowia sp.]MBN9406204.1 delta(1)-pyrroline-2-carboxylate reductase family protein [Burkholderiales bacterium]MBS0404595.1 delta(1)-pyrroline-2-carboxylate reductase family protein [Pseudomonadota bacterium]